MCASLLLALTANLNYYSPALRIEASDNKLLAFITSSMPEDLKCRLEDLLALSMGSTCQLFDRDSRDSVNDQQVFTFKALHFSWYNRMVTHVSVLFF